MMYRFRCRLLHGGRYSTLLAFALNHIRSKSRFQEEAQDKVGITPSYAVISENGPDHNKTFVIGVYLEEELVAEGKGSSKQEAQVAAAEKALEVKGW